MPFIIGNTYVSSYSIELGIFFIISSAIVLLILHKLHGNFSNLDAYFASKPWPFMKPNANIFIITRFFALMLLLFLLSPFASLALWGAVVIKLEEKYPTASLSISISNSSSFDIYSETVFYSDSHLGGKSILLAGFACLCFGFAAGYVKWSNFQIKKMAILVIVFGVGSFFAFQILVLLDDSNVSFYGMTAIFFGLNGILVIFLVFLTYSNQSASIVDIIKSLEFGSIKSNLKNFDTIEDLITEELTDNGFSVSQVEVFRMVTVYKTADQLKDTALGGGFITAFRTQKKWVKELIKFSLYLLSLGILVAYALVVYYEGQKSENKLGFLYLVMVFTTDVMVFFMTRVHLFVGPLEVSILVLANRVFLYAFGGEIWFIGYCCLYTFLNLFLCNYIVDHNWPLTDYSEVKLNQVLDLSRTPEFITFISTSMFIILIVVLALGNIGGIPTEGFQMTNGKNVPFWAFGIASIFFVFLFLCFRISVRIYTRYSLKIKDLVFYYVFNIRFDAYYISLSMSYLCLILIGGLCYALTSEPFPLIICCFLPVMYELSNIIVFNLRLNEYRFPADTKMINMKMQKCREKIEAQSKKTTKNVKQKINSKTSNLDKNPEKDKLIEDIEDILKESPEGEEQDPKQNEIHIVVEQENDENDKEEGGPVDPELWVKNGITKFFDWRDMKLGFWKAYIGNYLVPTDYKIIYASLLFILVNAGYCIASGLGSHDYKLIGPSVGVACFSAACFTLPIVCYLKTFQAFNLNDITLILFGAAANYGYGFFYFFDSAHNLDSDPSTYYLLFFVFVMPGCFLGFSGFQLWRENRFKFKSKSIIILFILSFAHFIGLGVFLCAAKISFIAGGIVIGLTFTVCLTAFLFYKFNLNNNSIPRKWLIIIITTLTLFTFSSLIAALIMDTFNDFIGYSIFILSLTMIVFLINWFVIYNDLERGNQQPIFFSPWIFPVFVYDSKLNSIKVKNFPYLILFACLLVFFIWSITVCIWVKPAVIGISIATLMEVIIALHFLYFSCKTSLDIGKFVHTDAFVSKAIKTAWLVAKKSFLMRKGVTDPDEIMGYEFYRTHFEKSKIALKDTIKDYVVNKNTEVNLRKVYKEFYHDLNVVQVEYISELRLLIHFCLELIVISYHTVIEGRMNLINFVQNERSKLFQNQIFIILETERTIEDKYSKIKRQYQTLDNEKKHNFDVLKKTYDEQKKLEKIETEKKHKAEEAAKKERMESLKHVAKTEEIDWSKPLSEIPDCLEKYKKIVENYKKDSIMYEDSKFKAGDTVLGEQLKNVVSAWARPSANAKIFKEGYNPLDIQQGSIGDCYFMSAISVIGEKFLKVCMYLDQLDSQDTGCGAYLIKFSVGESVIDVIIDDKFPVDKDGGWVMGHSCDKNELWPLILEKAYAKLYGGYYAIVGGKVSYALSELSGGVADEISLNAVKNNPENFWKVLLAYYNQGYLLGAGSPENPRGDAAFSEEGIVQGHAYAVLKVQDLDEVKLIKLRNPHGQHGREWTGDWSDGSYKWTTKLKAKINEEFAEDGAFWMAIDDFLYEFKYLYVCRIFDEKNWCNLEPLDGEWNGITAAGLPTKDNPKAKLQNNPQFTITVTKKCTAFITLVQKEAIDTFKGKLPIFWMVQREKGQKITVKADEKLVGSSGAPTNLKAVGKEVDLVSTSYPTTFTLMVASAFAGDKGKGSFFIRISCTDKAVKVKELK